MAAKLALVGLKKKLRGRQVLDGVDIDVAQGKSLVIIGGSGVGKSVTLKCALGLMKPDAAKCWSTAPTSRACRRKSASA